MEKFNYEPNGYNRKEVNQFISDVIDQTSGIVKKYTEQKEKIHQQEAEISKLREEVEHYHRIESNLKDTIIRAEHTADHIKYLAEQDSDIIVKDAKNSASRIVNEALIKAEKIDNQINNLMAIAESYPDLKANADFLSLQRNLNEIENKLSYARTSYNNAVTSFNNAVESVPSNIIAKIFNFEKKDLFQIESEKRENIKVNL